MPALALLLLVEGLLALAWLASPGSILLLAMWVGVSALLVTLAVWGAWFVRSRTPKRVEIGTSNLMGEWGGPGERRESVEYSQVLEVTDKQWNWIQAGRAAYARYTPSEVRFVRPGIDSRRLQSRHVDDESVFFLTDENAARVREAVQTWRVARYRTANDPLPSDEMDDETARELGEV